MEEGLKELFQKRFGAPAESVAALKGDGSNRRLFRLTGAGRSVIGAAGADLRENRAFLGFSRHFRACELPVPEIYAEDEGRGIYLEEDLGDTNLFQLLSRERTPDGIPAPVVEVYRKAVRWLPRFQLDAGRTLDYGLCYPRASFDKQSMLWDLSYFKYYFLRLAQIPFDEQALEDDFQRFADFLLEAERESFLYRDFQSRNIMVRGGQGAAVPGGGSRSPLAGGGGGEPWFIDYQGGRKGALQYDIASLLYDAKADLPDALRTELLELYLEAASRLAPLDRGRFMRYFPGYVLIRIMQAMGAYGLRGFYERKAHFLQSIPYAVRNIEALLRRHELPVKLPMLLQVLRAITASSRLRQLGTAELKLTVRVQSFSFRGGTPPDERGHGGGYVFDCRALPNPGRYEQYAKLTGKDADVAAFFEKTPEVARFLDHVYALVDQSVDNYRSRNFTDLMVSFGCTGGQHRSVYCAELLARRLRARGVDVQLRHLKQER